MRFLLILFFCCNFWIPSFGQNAELAATQTGQNESAPGAGIGLELNGLQGKIIRHNKNFTGPVPDHSKAIELHFIQQTHGTADWQQRRRFPQVGLGLQFVDYGLDSVYGKVVAFYPTFQLRFIRRKHFEWTFRVGPGLGYVTRKFERYPVVDTANNAIGSHLNNFTTVCTDIRWRINDHWDVQTGLNFSHLSNGTLAKPNLGINMYAARFGIRYFPVSGRPKLNVQEDLPILRNRWLLQVRYGMAWQQQGSGGGPTYPVYIGSIYSSKRLAGKTKLFAGADAAYYPRIYAYMRNNEAEPGHEAEMSWKAAVFAGHEWLFGHVGLQVQVGYYVKQAYQSGDVFYQKLGGNFYLLKREHGLLKELFASMLLKVHLGQAELAEFGLGVGI